MNAQNRIVARIEAERLGETMLDRWKADAAKTRARFDAQDRAIVQVPGGEKLNARERQRVEMTEVGGIRAAGKIAKRVQKRCCDACFNLRPVTELERGPQNGTQICATDACRAKAAKWVKVGGW